MPFLPPQASSPFGSRESLSSIAADSKVDSRSLQEENLVAAIGEHMVIVDFISCTLT